MRSLLDIALRNRLVQNVYFIFFNANNYTFKLAVTEEEKKEVFALRYRVYCEELGYHDPQDYPDKLESDPYDKYSIFPTIFDSKGRLIGLARIIQENPLGFPMEESFDLEAKFPKRLRNEQFAEVSRLILSKTIYNEKRWKRQAVLLHFYRFIHDVCNKNEITHIFALIDEKLFKKISSYDLFLQPLGEARWFHGHRTIPIVLEFSHAKEMLKIDNPLLYNFFSSTEP